MQDLVLKSHKHQRFENGIPVLGEQFCGRAITVENKNFKEIFRGMPVSPESGFLVRMFNLDMPLSDGRFQDMMQPKLMVLESDSYNQIKLKGVQILSMGIATPAGNFSNYSLTLDLLNRKVAKATLHIHDRNIDIEYMDLEP